MEDLQKYVDILKQFALNYGLKIIGAIIVLIIGFWVTKQLTKIVVKVMEKRNLDKSLHTFFKTLVSVSLKVLIIITAISMIGVKTTSFVAILGAAGLAIGLALQGSLANFAGGVLILIFKSYKVGDLIDAQGVVGVVKEIQIFNTILTGLANKTIILPNGMVSNGIITNLTTQGILRVDLVVGISYGDNIKKAKDVIMNVMENDDKVLKDPAPFVGVSELADSSVNLVDRPHVKVEHYWDVYFGITEKVKIALDENNISIPFPQRDVNFKNAIPAKQ